MDDAITSKWFYDDRVVSEQDVVRTENRARVRGARASVPKGPKGEERVVGNEHNNDNKSKLEDVDKEEEEERNDSSHFWDPEQACSYLREQPSQQRDAAAKAEAYYEVDEDALGMMHEVMANYKQRIQAAMVDTASNRREASKEVELRWKLVEEYEKIEQNAKELNRKSLTEQSNFSTARKVFLKFEEELQRLRNENDLNDSANRKQAKRVAQMLSAGKERKSEKERVLRKAQQDYEHELVVKEDIQDNRGEKIEQEIKLCRENVADLERNSNAAKAKLEHCSETTKQFRSECDALVETLLSVNKDLKTLRSARRVEESVLEVETEMGGCDEKQLGGMTRDLIRKVNEEIDAKRELQEKVKEKKKALDAAAAAGGGGVASSS